MKNAPILIMYTVIFIVLCVLASITRKGRIKEKAIRAGVAYYTNDASGMSQFKWKECK